MILLVVLIGPPLNAHLTQQRNLRLVERHIAEKLAPLFSEHKKSGEVEFFFNTGGKLGVVADVESREDLEELCRLVRATEPPVPILWEIQTVAVPAAQLRSSP